MTKENQDFYSGLADREAMFDEIRKRNRQLNPTLGEPEDYKINPEAKVGDADYKSGRKLKDIYPGIEHYRKIPTHLYTSKEVKEKEWKNMWKNTWIMAGRVEDLKDVGDWFKFDIAHESIIVVRSEEDKVQAFYNVCKHRGNQLVREDKGKGYKSFVCSYHSWMFKLDGQNARVTDKNTFAPEILGCDLNLEEVNSHVWGGFVFINMSEDPMSFEQYFDEVLPMMDTYKMENMHIVKETQLRVPANWKVFMDAFQETYHVHHTHPQGLLGTEDHFIQYDFYKNGHNRLIQRKGVVSKRRKDTESVNPVLANLLKDVGIDADAFEGTAHNVRDALIAAKKNEDNHFGFDYSGFTDSQMVDNWNVTFFPNITFNTYPEGVLIQRFRPDPDDPDYCVYDVMVLAAKLKEDTRPFVFELTFGVNPSVDISGNTRPEKEYTTMDDPKMGVLLEQDLEQIEYVSKGLKSKGLGGHMRLSEQERRLQQFYAELDLYLNELK